MTTKGRSTTAPTTDTLRTVNAKRAEHFVLDELLKLGVMPYQPVAESGNNFLLRTGKNSILELRLVLSDGSGRDASNTFAMLEFKPSKKHFIAGVEFDEADNPVAWVFPSVVFYAYSAGPDRKGLRSLKLDMVQKKYLSETLRDHLRGFRNRWELFSEYSFYRRYMNSPEGYEDLEDIVTAQESLEQPEEEKIAWEEYVRSIP